MKKFKVSHRSIQFYSFIIYRMKAYSARDKSGINSYISQDYVKRRRSKKTRSVVKGCTRTMKMTRTAAAAVAATAVAVDQKVLSVFRTSQKTFNNLVKARSEGTFGLPMTALSYYNIIECIGREIIKTRHVFEIGCGTGTFVMHLINSGAQFVIGTDFQIIVPSMVKKYKNAVFVAHDMLDLDEIPEGIQIITMFIGNEDVIYHILDLFEASKHVDHLIFLLPAHADNKKPIAEHIAETFKKEDFTTTNIKVQVLNGNSVRYCTSIKRNNTK
jgi:hypothetical protein